MSKPLHQTKKLVSISEASQILGVSLDTIRRWDKTGLLHSERPDGKNRYFSLDELKAFKLNQPLSISEASYELHVSPTTLRRLVKKGLIQSSRNSAGERVFNKDSIKDFLASDYFIRKMSAGQKEKTIKKVAPDPVQPKETIQEKVVAKTVETVAASNTLLPWKNWQLVSSAFASVVIFILLTAIGVTNIQITSVEASQATRVDSDALKNQPFVVPLISKVGKTKSLLNSVDLIPAKPSEATPGALLKIGLSDDGLTYTVETASSSAHRSATESASTSHIDAFVIDSIDAQGYHLKLPDGSLGFVPIEKVTKQEVKTND